MPGISTKKTSSDTAENKPSVDNNAPNNLPVIPIKEGVLFPATESVLNFGREVSLTGIKVAAKDFSNYVVLLSQKKPNEDDPSPSDLYRVGTLAIIERTIKTEEAVSALVRGVKRVKIEEFTQRQPYFAAKISNIDDQEIGRAHV